MADYQFTVMHGDTAIPVAITNADDAESAAIQAAAGAAEHMKSKPFVVYDYTGQCHGTFTHSDIDEWWA